MCVTFSGCANFEEMNINRNAISNSAATTFVQPVTFSYQYRLLDYHWSTIAQLMQYSVAQILTADNVYNYRIQNAIPTGYWTNFYYLAGNAEAMLEQAKLDNIDTAVAVAEILKVMSMHVLTDAFGDVPYFEALKDYVSGGVSGFEPRYDKQKEIYRDLFQLLEDANSRLAASETDFDASDDYMYGGNALKWRKFGNSLYVRLLMRVAVKDEIDFESESLHAVSKLNEIFSYPSKYPVFESREDAANVPFDSAIAGQRTPFYSHTAGTWNGSMICDRLMNEMYDEESGLNDPRLSSMFDNKRVGAPTQVTYSELVEYSSIAAHFNRGKLQNADYYPIMRFSELWFIWAEAAHRGWISGTVKSYYDRAVAESIYEWNDQISDITVANFLAHSRVSIDGLDGESRLERIMTQKWISNVFLGIEAWCDFRRTGYPEMPVKSLAGNGGILPTRFAYPADEEFRNRDNFNEAVNGWLGGVNNMTTQVWWADHDNKRKQ